MSIFDDFPLMNAYSVNLDWIIKKIREVEEFVRNYAAVNNVAYAGVWDITKQYPQWALVTDGDTSWLALRPVPKGIPLENAEYWQKLADLDPRISGIITELADINDELSAITSKIAMTYNVKFYGAVGDGATDDTEAIQRCFDAAMEQGGGRIIFPAGVYCVSDTLVIRPHTPAAHDESMQNIHFAKMDILQICGEGFAEIKAIKAMEYILKTDDFTYPGKVGSYSNFYTRVENVQLNGNGLANCGLYLYQALHASVERCRVCNTTERGIDVYGYGELYIANNVIKAPRICIKSTSGGDSCIFKNDFFPSVSGVCYEGTAYSGSTIYQKNTAIPYGIESATENTSIGVKLRNGKWNDADALTGPVFICNNSFDDIHCCINLYSANPANNVAQIECYHNKISAGYDTTKQIFVSAVGCTQIGIHDNVAGIKPGYSRPLHAFAELTNCSQANIHDNSICGSLTAAIILYNCTMCDVKSNNIQSFALQDAYKGAISIGGNSTNNIVKDNIVNQDGDTSVYATLSKVGIAEAGTADYNTAIDNSFVGAIDTEYVKVGASSVMYSSISGYAAPTDGTWTKGSVCKNLEPWGDAKTAMWICVTAGTPGTWGKIKWIE